jgi:CsoR family transcriptional regulator, copper-sensing transcriptional repressor
MRAKPRKNAVAIPSLAEEKAKLLLRLKRAEGQVRAVIRLIEEGSPCEPVAQQLAASRKALDRTFYALLGCALVHGELAQTDIESLLTRYV